LSRLIVVSNRVNPPGDPAVGTVGGLAMALAAALRDDKGLWFGWSGKTVDAYSGQISMQKIGGVTVALLDLDAQDESEYYNGYANRTLWPLCLYRPDLVNYERSFDQGYMRVNQRFAETLLPLIGPYDLIWVQDYHLIPLASELRKRGVTNRIGFFLHIPWPARRVFQVLPGHRELVDTLFDYDLVGFQTEDDRSAFADYAVHYAAADARPSGELVAGRRTVMTGAFPIGLDAESFGQAVASETAHQVYRAVRKSQAGRKMLIGVDRLDHTKGLEDRLLAYEMLLGRNPELREKVFLLQIATPSREDVEAYQDLRHRLDNLSGKINGGYATHDWVPLRYVNRSYRRDELAGMYRAAHVGLVTPLRDGMNLVAKEYVAAQNPADPGVLILSEFAGAAAQMTSALIVNPLDREQVSDAIRLALSMPRRERQRRWEALFGDVVGDDINAWRDSFVDCLKRTPEANLPAGSEVFSRVATPEEVP